MTISGHARPILEGENRKDARHPKSVHTSARNAEPKKARTASEDARAGVFLCGVNLRMLFEDDL